MDQIAWWATFHRVGKSWTRLKQLSVQHAYVMGFHISSLPSSNLPFLIATKLSFSVVQLKPYYSLAPDFMASWAWVQGILWYGTSPHPQSSSPLAAFIHTPSAKLGVNILEYSVCQLLTMCRTIDWPRLYILSQKSYVKSSYSFHFTDEEKESWCCGAFSRSLWCKWWSWASSPVFPAPRSVFFPAHFISW